MKKEKTETILNSYIIGVDLGQSQDYTAISVLEVRQSASQKPVYYVRHLERPSLGTPYPQIIEKVERIYNSLNKENIAPALVLDVTGVGRPVFDTFMQANLSPIGIQIHGGSNVTQDGSIFNVPKRDLAGVLQVLYQNGRIKVSARLKDAHTFNNELLNFKVKINIKTGHDSYEAWRDGIHDDLVLSVACGAWYGERSEGKDEGGIYIGGLESGFSWDSDDEDI